MGSTTKAEQSVVICAAHIFAQLLKVLNKKKKKKIFCFSKFGIEEEEEEMRKKFLVEKIFLSFSFFFFFSSTIKQKQNLEHNAYTKEYSYMSVCVYFSWPSNTTNNNNNLNPCMIYF